MSAQPSPLEQLEQQNATQDANTGPKSDLSPLEQLEQQAIPAQPTGEITNDVGQTVIVPKEGESFQDTLKRAVAHTNSMTPEQRQQAIDAETKTIPEKAGETLAGAAGIGVAGPALLAVPGEVADIAIKHLAGNVLPGLEGEAAKQALIRAIPHALQFVKALGEIGIGAGGATYLLKTLMGGGK